MLAPLAADTMKDGIRHEVLLAQPHGFVAVAVRSMVIGAHESLGYRVTHEKRSLRWHPYYRQRHQRG